MSSIPTVSYLICCTPRSGSWLLCDALAQTGIAGYPQEYLLSHAVFDEQWGSPTKVTFTDFLALVREEATTPNGVCGVKVHWSQIRYLLNVLEVGPGELLDRLKAELPGLMLIRLRRTDKLRQALSYHRALVQQQWWEFASEPPRPSEFAPDFDQVARLVRLLETHDRDWDEFCAITPEMTIDLRYEELAADLSGHVYRLLLALGSKQAEAWFAADGVKPRLRRQSDQRTELWVHQYISRKRGTCLPLTAIQSQEMT